MATQFIGLNESQERTNLSPGGADPTDADLKRENLDLLEKRRQDVVSSAIDVRRAFFIFGAFSLYLIITVSSTTHLQLLTGTVFELPILSVDIPILGFYVALPLLYLLAHANLMGELNVLSEDVRRLKLHLIDADLKLLEKIPFGPARTLIQPDDSSAPRFLINLVTSLAIAVLPPLILLLIQVRFLPYHSDLATWFHRVIILFDIVLVFSLWLPLKIAYFERLQLINAKQLSGRRRRIAQLKNAFSFYLRLRWVGLIGCGAVMLLVLTVSFVWVTVPDGSWEKFLVEEFEERGFSVKTIGSAPTVSESDEVRDWTYHGVTPAERKMLVYTYRWFEAHNSWHWMRRNLIVSHKDLVATRPSDEVLFFLEDDERETDKREKEVWEQGARGLDLRGRNLRYAIFSYSDMHKVDLRGADLQGAVFFKTKLRYADLGDIFHAELGRCANEPFFKFFFDKPIDGRFRMTEKIEYNRVILCRTNLRNATLKNVEAQHARFWKSYLVDSDMRWAKLNNADLSHSQLRGADLKGALLEDAGLGNASLHRSNLEKAKVKDDQLKYILAECRATWSEVTKDEDDQNEPIDSMKIDTSVCHERFLQ